MDEVLLRKPKTLLVNIGSNDGVWLLAFNGYNVDTCYYSGGNSDGELANCATAGTTTASKALADYTANMKIFATLMQKYSAGTSTVYMDLLPRPSAAANLDPATTRRLRGNPAYFAQYRNYFGLQGVRTIPGAKVAAMDALVQQTNTDVADAVCGILGSHVTFIDLPRLLSLYDSKNGHGKTIDVDLPFPKAGKTAHLDNRRVDAVHAVKTTQFHLGQGGLFSYDNMHPTAMGYTLLANAISSAAHGTAPAYGVAQGGCPIVMG